MPARRRPLHLDLADMLDEESPVRSVVLLAAATAEEHRLKQPFVVRDLLQLILPVLSDMADAEAAVEDHLAAVVEMIRDPPADPGDADSGG